MESLLRGAPPDGGTCWGLWNTIHTTLEALPKEPHHLRSLPHSTQHLKRLSHSTSEALEHTMYPLTNSITEQEAVRKLKVNQSHVEKRNVSLINLQSHEKKTVQQTQSVGGDLLEGQMLQGVYGCCLTVPPGL